MLHSLQVSGVGEYERLTKWAPPWSSDEVVEILALRGAGSEYGVQLGGNGEADLLRWSGLDLCGSTGGGCNVIL